MTNGEKKDERPGAEEKYKALVETAADAIFTLDLLGRLTFMNPAGERISGYSEEELVGRHFRELLPAKHIPACLNVFQKALRGQPTPLLEIEMITKQGDRVPLELLGRPVKRGRRVVEIIAIARDITERKEAEEALRKRVKELTCLYAIERDMQEDLSVDELCRRVIEHLVPALQFPEITVPVIELDDRRLTSERYTEGLSHGLQAAIRVAGETRGQLSVYYAEERPFLIPEEQNLINGIAEALGQWLDRKRAEEEIRRRSEELAALYDASLDAAAQLDLDALLKTTLLRAQELLRANAGGLYLYDPERQDLELMVHQGLSKDYTGTRLALGEGACGKVAQSGDPLVVTDYAKWDGRSSHFADEPTFSVLAVPIKRGDALLGALYVNDYDLERSFEEGDIRLATLFANQAATAIENARLYEETQKRLSETTVLHKVSEIINSTLDLKEVFQRVVEELSNAFGYRLVDIYLLEEQGLRLQAQVGYDHKTTIDFTPLERGVVGRVARTGQPAFITDVSQDPEYIPTCPEIKSEICVPVKSGETLLGTLNVKSDAKRPLTDDDLKLLVTLSSHIGVAIDNARLYQEVQARTVYLETLQRINATLRSTLPLREVLDTIVRAATEALGYVGSFIAIPDATGECLTLGAAWGGRIVDAALKVTRFKLESFSVPVKVQENLIARAFVSGELQAATGNPEALAVGTEPSISGKMASTIERISGAKGTTCVPLRVGEKSVGVLIIVSPREQLADDERAMLLGLADQAGLAIQNARLYEETQQLAVTDGLTGLYNSRYFYEALDKEIQRSERYHRSVSLIILDIDNFKRYNDTYGHLAGDDLLIKLAQLMSKVTRQTDTLARYGGEEFTIILPETEIEGAGFLAERLQEDVREHRFSIQDDQTIGRITISLGVATYPHHADSAKALVGAADKALLRAKRAGKNRLSVYGEELIELKPR